ncbi:MAG TPA: BatD family protein, partial [Longimicrobiales bacterium]
MRFPALTTTLLTAALAAGLAGAARAQVRVDASVSPNAARVGDVVVLDISILSGGAGPDAIDVPPLPSGLRITGSNDYTEYEFRMPGGRRRTTRRELTVTTVAAGHYVIPPIAVRIEGTVYRTRPLRLDVAPGVMAGPPGESSGGPDDEVLLQSWASPDTVYVGQQVTVRADALFSTDVRSRLAGAPQYEAPSAPGFWVYDLPTRDATQYRPVRGRLYEVQTFRRAFFPLNPGTLFVPGSHLTYAVRRGFLSGPENYDLRSDSFRVVVRSLPPAGRPLEFAGAVGRYTASAHVEPTRVATGEATTLTVEVAGNGNIKAIPPPRLPPLSGVQVFSPAEDSDLRPDDETVGGTKRFTWVLVPSHPGQLVIPALELPYFDPAQHRYQIARTEPQAVGVIAGS